MNSGQTPASRRVLLTGATGFIGSHCLRPLVHRGFEVFATYKSRQPPAVDGVRWFSADLLTRDGCRAVIDEAKASHLLHLAWYVEPGKLISHPSNLDWCCASIELLRLFHESGGSRCVAGGSCYEYDWRYGFCNESTTPRQPDTLYGAAKLGLSEMMAAFCASVGLSSAWGRMFFLYGPKEHPQRLVPAIVRALLSGELAKSSHGQQIRDYAHVQDVADGLVALLDSDARGPYNIATGRAITVASIVEALGELSGRSDLLRIGILPARANDAPMVVGDPMAAKRAFGWEAQIPLRDGLKATLDWWTRELSNKPQQSR